MSNKRPQHSSHKYASSFSSSKHPSSSKSVHTKSPKNEKQNITAIAELITYRLDNEMVYVEPAPDFQSAVNYAYEVFPQLDGVDPKRIVFNINVRIKCGQGKDGSIIGQMKKVRVSPNAWPRMVKALVTYEVVDLTITPDIQQHQSSESQAIYNHSSLSGDVDREEAGGKSTYESGGRGAEEEEAPPQYQEKTGLIVIDSKKPRLYTHTLLQDKKNGKSRRCECGSVASCISEDTTKRGGRVEDQSSTKKARGRSSWVSFFCKRH